MSRQALARCIKLLEAAHLVHVDRHAGRSPMVTIKDAPDSDSTPPIGEDEYGSRLYRRPDGGVETHVERAERYRREKP
ncbi:MAG TPA: hypothetical protein PKY77_25910 [Phycisphaerae bacterium]|nr:hypothetical protein [Phycisphaerae bacterium]HRY66846.1 hypothetical protein [Phycisphaerae bacterium]HSA26904.1 hypothetical protein [Phycisphaerae bacterium]